MDLIDLLRKQGGQYLRDIMPGGLLSPEIPPEMPTQTLKGLLGFTPVVGDAISGYDAIQSAREGNYGEAALNSLGLLPFVPAMARPIRDTQLFGREIVPEAIRAQESLSGAARDFGHNWNFNWNKGQREFIDSDVAKELQKAFAPVKEKLNRVYGETMPLFRGEQNAPTDPNKILFSWTPSEDLAKKFAYGGKIPPTVTDAQVKNAIRNFNEKGFVSFGGNTYVRNKSNPAYYLIYDKNGQLLTDGDNFAKEAIRIRNDREEWIDKIKSRGVVHSKDVPVKDSFWIPVGANISEPEIISRFNPR